MNFTSFSLNMSQRSLHNRTTRIFLLSLVCLAFALPRGTSVVPKRHTKLENMKTFGENSLLQPEVGDSLAASNAIAQSFARIAKSELHELQENITLSAWRQRHPHDSLICFRYELEQPTVSNEQWCVSADEVFSLPGTQQVALRRAYFYAPPPPPSLVLPQLSDSVRVRTNEAVLGMIWVEMIERSPEASITIANSVQEGLSSWLGSGKVGTELWGYGSSGWSCTDRWQTGDQIYACACGVSPEYGQPPRVVAFGFLPISEVHIDADYNEYSVGGAPSHPDSVIFSRTLRKLGANRERANELITIYLAGRMQQDSSLDRPNVLGAFRRWIDICANTDREARAAGLAFADQVLSAITDRLALDSTIVSQFEPLGAIIRQSRTMGWIYEHSWLKQALALDSSGAVGELALILMMQRGFQLEAGCTCGACFGRVILEGEKYLPRATDPEFQKMTHFILAYAYSDIVAIHSGIPSTVDDDSGIAITVDQARSKAVGHFRQAISADTSSAGARIAWREAWRLVATLPPTAKNFVCEDE